MPPGVTVPGVPGDFHELTRLEVKELEYMQANHQAVDDWLRDVPAVKEYVDRLDNVRSQNASLAREIIEKEEQMQIERSKLDKQCSTVAQRREAVEELLRMKAALENRADPARIADELEARARLADAEAEQSLTDVLDAPGGTLGAQALADFRSKYLEGKRLKHQRLALRERLRASG